MKHCCYVLLILLTACQLAFAQTSGKGIEGNWGGKLVAEGTELRLVVTLTKTSSGAYSGTLESVDQGATVAIDTITVSGDVVKLEVKEIGAAYEATLNKDQSEMTGKWMQAGFSLSLTLKASTPEPKPDAKPGTKPTA